MDTSIKLIIMIIIIYIVSNRNRNEENNKEIKEDIYPYIGAISIHPYNNKKHHIHTLYIK